MQRKATVIPIDTRVAGPAGGGQPPHPRRYAIRGLTEREALFLRVVLSTLRLSGGHHATSAA